jgi:hypothetical protein
MDMHGVLSLEPYIKRYNTAIHDATASPNGMKPKWYNRVYFATIGGDGCCVTYKDERGIEPAQKRFHNSNTNPNPHFWGYLR